MFPGGKKQRAGHLFSRWSEACGYVQGTLRFSAFSPAQLSYWTGNRYTTESWRCNRNSPAFRIVWERSSYGRDGRARIPTTISTITLESSRFASNLAVKISLRSLYRQRVIRVTYGSTSWNSILNIAQNNQTCYIGTVSFYRMMYEWNLV